MLVDALIVLESLVISILLRFDGQVPKEYWHRFWPFAVLSVVVFVGLLYRSGAYRNVLRYTGVYQGVRIAGATAVAVVVLVVADLLMVEPFFRARGVPLSVVAVGSVIAFVQLVAVRLYPRIFSKRSLREDFFPKNQGTPSRCCKRQYREENIEWIRESGRKEGEWPEARTPVPREQPRYCGTVASAS